MGQPAPPLAGKTVDGTPLALQDLRGKVVLVNVWATWCKPCNIELPELARLHDQRSDAGFSVLGVSIDKRQLLHKVRNTMARHSLKFPMMFDPESRAIAGWEVSGYPTSILVGRDGTIRWRRNGMIELNDKELSRQLDSALAEPVP
ncbi:MAG: TlpA family protein disulfide reductase [Deltaproteobacteria bacterium]|nr:TlpA family protein disulfide reductase [Deltaproteobacteria bacterium]